MARGNNDTVRLSITFPQNSSHNQPEAAVHPSSWLLMVRWRTASCAQPLIRACPVCCGSLISTQEAQRTLSTAASRHPTIPTHIPYSISLRQVPSKLCPIQQACLNPGKLSGGVVGLWKVKDPQPNTSFSLASTPTTYPLSSPLILMVRWIANRQSMWHAWILCPLKKQQYSLPENVTSLDQSLEIMNL